MKRKGWQIIGFYEKAEKSLEDESDGDANCRCCTLNCPKGPGKETGRTGD